MKTIKIEEQKLRDTLKEVLREAFDFGWIGWRLPIYTDNQGNLSIGDWLSQNSYQPDAIELPINIGSWGVDYENPSEEELYEEIQERVEFILEHFENSLKNINPNLVIEIV